MDATHWTGDDERDVLDPANDEHCPDCGAHVDDDCHPACRCRDCLRSAEAQAMRRLEDGITREERDSLEREQMVEALKLK